jgi:hypothetical protein
MRPDRVKRRPRQLSLADNQLPAGFDFTAHIHRLCRHIASHSPQLAHIDMQRVAVSFNQARKPGPYGLQASLTPLRFENGATSTRRRGQQVSCQQLLDANGHEMLYILRFYLPRYLNGSLMDKLTTLFHELWHISPRFDGDLRRFPGRCYIHTSKEAHYDAEVTQLAQQWLATDPPRQLYSFLEHDFRQLQSIHQRVVGVRIPRPKLIPLDNSAA